MSYGVQIFDDNGRITFDSTTVAYHVSREIIMGKRESLIVNTKVGDAILVMPINVTSNSILPPVILKHSDTNWEVRYLRPYPQIPVDMRYIVEVKVLVCSA